MLQILQQINKLIRNQLFFRHLLVLHQTDMQLTNEKQMSAERIVITWDKKAGETKSDWY